MDLSTYLLKLSQFLFQLVMHYNIVILYTEVLLLY